MMFILQVIAWILIIYGFFSLAQDIINEFTYKKIQHIMKIIILTKDLNNNIERFAREFSNIKKSNSYKDIVVIDLEDDNNIETVTKELENQEINIRLLNKSNGQKYLLNYFENENISFL